MNLQPEPWFLTAVKRTEQTTVIIGNTMPIFFFFFDFVFKRTVTTTCTFRILLSNSKMYLRRRESNYPLSSGVKRKTIHQNKIIFISVGSSEKKNELI